MSPRLLWDTHVLVRWLFDSRRLSRQQLRTIEKAVQRGEPIALSAISLLEIADLVGLGKRTLRSTLTDFLAELRGNPVLRLLPLSYEVAMEVASIGVLKDPADRVIVATARHHRLQLKTSDERILKCKLVTVIE